MRALSSWFLKMLLMMGIRNAAVFPVPVFARPMKSRPSKIGLMAWSWMGVG